MHKPAPALTLLNRQTRMINASEGLRLEVQSGCLWLTRPGDAADHFLRAGASIELHEKLVLIQGDQLRGEPGLEVARYRLTPLQAPKTKERATSTNGWKARLVEIRLSAGGRHAH